MALQLSPAVQEALAKFQKLSAKATVKTQARTAASAYKRTLTPKRKAVEPAPIARLNPLSDRWVYEALVLPISRVTCKTCGHVSEVNGGKLLLARRDKRTGAIWESTAGATCQLPELPKRRRVHNTTSEACGKCFDGLANLAAIECMIPVKEHPVPVFDTPSAYEAAQRIAAMRGKAKPEPMPTTIDSNLDATTQLEMSLEDL